MKKDELFLKEAYIHYDYFVNIAKRMTQNDFDAEDLAQDTFIRAFRFIDQFEPGTNCKAWLFRIMKNLFINFSIKKQAHPHCGLESVINEPATSPIEPGLRYFEFVMFLEKIKEEYRTVMMLYHINEYSLSEISKELNWPIGTVKSRLHRARKQIRQAIAENN